MIWVIPKIMMLRTLADVPALIERHLPQHFGTKATWRYVAPRLEEAAHAGSTAKRCDLLTRCGNLG